MLRWSSDPLTIINLTLFIKSIFTWSYVVYKMTYKSFLLCLFLGFRGDDCGFCEDGRPGFAGESGENGFPGQ